MLGKYLVVGTNHLACFFPIYTNFLLYVYVLLLLGIPTNGGHDLEAVYVGAVGPRFEKPNFMDWQEIINDKSSESDYKDSPIANLFLKLYSERLGFEASSCSAKIKDDLVQYIHSYHYCTFNAPIYRERISISAETYLLEANQRGKSMGLNVHVVVVGLGLGVWEFPEIHNQVCLFKPHF